MFSSFLLLVALFLAVSDAEFLRSNTTTSISRGTVIARAQDWVNRGIMYSQTSYTDGYRQDCSGYVSMAWQTSTSGGGHTTYNMQDLCYRIDRSQLQPGDAILNPSNHVLLFDQWVDGESFWQYAEIDYGRPATHNVVGYSWFANNGYFPCRFNNIN
jgi:hypothetical protein